MDLKKFNLFNNVLGWIIFILAAFVYLSTIEPTVSLWDCGEFIAGSNRLEVVHPPGAPFFLMIHRFFTMFTSDPTMVPIIVNSASAIWSAFTILFLFWSISLLAQKFILKNKEEVSLGESIAIFGASAVGALAYTFSDSFWFSAVEGEVYAMSSFFTGLVFWLLLKWDRRADQPDNLKWFILIFYVMGISIGVHLLSLLILPVSAFVYYFRKYDKIDGKGVIISFIVGMAILGIINVGIIKWIPAIASKFEILFVNSFGLPYWSGVIFTIILLFGGYTYGIIYSHKKNKVILNTIIVSLFAVSIGYASYTMVAIRSNANTPIDYSNPDNIFNMLSYINREQYGDRPIVYGPQFNSRNNGYVDGRKIYVQRDGKYKEVGRKKEPKYDADEKVLFPRMSDIRSDREAMYRYWAGMDEIQNQINGYEQSVQQNPEDQDLQRRLQTLQLKKPTFGQNLKFFFSYQLGHMYWRYFAWNFIGRQNDEQGHGKYYPGGFMSGNWISGINFIDEKLVGNQEYLPYEQKVNQAHNKLYFLPFLFGLLGMFYHFRKNKKDAISVMGFFLITGILLVVYQNSPPFEPRERDYTLVGSFYAYAIWIGLGVLAIIDFLRKKMDLIPASAVAVIVSLLAVPVLMANQEWDDHSRAHRYSSRDFGINYLESCEKDAILFTNGDNDTYPLWYAQEVEGIRDDVRVINLQLLNTDWYVDQLRRKQNNSSPIKFSLGPDQITEGTRDQVFFKAEPALGKQHIDIHKIVDFIGSDEQVTKLAYGPMFFDYYPTKKVSVDVPDKNVIIDNKIVGEEFYDQIVDKVKFNIGRGSILKSHLMTLDIIANNTWERPIYFAITSGSDTYLGLENYFQQEGMSYRLVPVKANLSPQDKRRGETGRVYVDKMYDNMMNKFQWGNLTDERVHIGSVSRRHCTTYRQVFGTLAEALLKEGENEKAIEVVKKCLEVFPDKQVPHSYYSWSLLKILLEAGDKETALDFGLLLAERFETNLKYFNSLNTKQRQSAQNDINLNKNGLEILVSLAQTYGLEELYNRVAIYDTNKDKQIQQQMQPSVDQMQNQPPMVAPNQNQENPDKPQQ